MSKTINDCRELVSAKGDVNPHLAQLEANLVAHQGTLWNWDDYDSDIHWLDAVNLLKLEIGALIRKYRLQSSHFSDPKTLGSQMFHEGRPYSRWDTRAVDGSTILHFERGDAKHPLGPINFLQLSTLLGGGPLTELSDIAKGLFGDSPSCVAKSRLNCLDVAMKVVVKAGDRLDDLDAHERLQVNDNTFLSDLIRQGAPNATVAENDIQRTRSGGEVWVAVIDGVRNYRRGRLHWVTGLAVVSYATTQPKAICAAVYNPPTRELFVAMGDCGALAIDKKRNLPRKLPLISTTPQRHNVAVHLSTHRPEGSRPILDGLPSLLKDCERIEVMSCGLLALCHVADGRIDAFANAVTMDRPASVLAGKTILEAVGGKVEDYSGAEWQIGSSGVVAFSSTGSAARDLLLQHVVPH